MKTNFKFTRRTLIDSPVKRIACNEQLRERLGLSKKSASTDRFLTRIATGIHQANTRLVEIVKNKIMWLFNRFVTLNGLSGSIPDYMEFTELLNMLISYEFQGFDNKNAVTCTINESNEDVVLTLNSGGCPIVIQAPGVLNSKDILIKQRNYTARYIFIVSNASGDLVKKQVATMIANIPLLYPDSKDKLDVQKLNKFVTWYNYTNKQNKLPNGNSNEIRLEVISANQGKYIKLITPRGVCFNFMNYGDRIECTLA